MPFQRLGLAKTILSIAKQWIDLTKHSDFLQSSFRKYQWREALLFCLAKLTEGFVLKDPELILKEREELTRQSTHTSRIDPRRFLRLISDNDMIPMTSKPHSIFFLSSEQNFVASSFDWIMLSIAETGKMKVSMSLWFPSIRH